MGGLGRLPRSPEGQGRQRNFRAPLQRVGLGAGAEDPDRAGRRLSRQNGPRQERASVGGVVGAGGRQLGPLWTAPRRLLVVGGRAAHERSAARYLPSALDRFEREFVAGLAGGPQRAVGHFFP